MALTEKMRMYGMISSVGATKKQRRRLVHLEAAAMGLWGIPIGILCGLLATAVLVGATGGLMEAVSDVPLVFTVSVPAMVLGILLSGITLYLSAGQKGGPPVSDQRDQKRHRGGNPPERSSDSRFCKPPFWHRRRHRL